MRQSKKVVAAIAALSCVSLAACKGSSGGGLSTSSGPIKIGMIATTSSQTPTAFVNTWSVDGVKAAVKKINAGGGINGRKIDLTVCDNGGDPNRDATCAGQAKSDGWVAVVGGFDPYAPAQTLPILSAANIPYIGYLQGTPVEYQSKNSFPVEIGTVGGYIGTFSQMMSDGCAKAVFIGATDSGSDETAKQAKAVLGSKVTVVPFATGTTDVTPIVAAALAKSPDCVVFGGSGPDAAKVFTAIRKAGSNAALYAPPGVLQPQILSALGKVADGIKGASSSPLPSSPDQGMKTFLADLAAYSKTAVPNEFTIDGYAAVQLFKQVASGLKDITAKSLLSKLQNTFSVTVPMFGTLNFTSTRKSTLYPRVPNANVWFSVVKNGQWTGVTASQSPSNIEKFLP